MTRKDFLNSVLCGAAGLYFGAGREKNDTIIQTVTGPIPARSMGLTLPHEHVMCDFIGADKVGRGRYNPDEVVETMIPYMNEIRELGVKTFVDCTPAYIGRDPEILARISRDTGFYKEPFLPKFAWELFADQLADRWVQESMTGIEGTQIRPGFIKIAVNPGSLIPIQQKIVLAACKTQKRTGMTIASHTGKGISALEQLDILEQEGIEPRRFIFVHAQSEANMAFHFEVARRGAWVEYDGINEKSAARDLLTISAMVEQGYEHNILLSQDSGWYNVGKENGGSIRGYAFIMRIFLPLLEKNGFSKPLIDRLTVDNPMQAFAL